MLLMTDQRNFEQFVYTVYKTTNLVNNKYYIGYHKTLNLDDDYLGSGNYLWNSIRKYGVTNFKKETLFIFDNPKEAFAKEMELIDLVFKKDCYCMNLNQGGGYDPNGETKQKIGLACKGNKGRTGQTRSKEERAKVSRTLKGHTVAIETRKKISNANTGKKPTEETRQKLSKSCKGKGHPQLDETRRKIKRANTGKKHSDEAKKKIGDASRGRIQSKEEKAKRILSIVKASNTEESKKNRREGAKKRPPISEETRERMSKAAKLRRATQLLLKFVG